MGWPRIWKWEGKRDKRSNGELRSFAFSSTCSSSFHTLITDTLSIHLTHHALHQRSRHGSHAQDGELAEAGNYATRALLDRMTDCRTEHVSNKHHQGLEYLPGKLPSCTIASLCSYLTSDRGAPGLSSIMLNYTARRHRPQCSCQRGSQEASSHPIRLLH